MGFALVIFSTGARAHQHGDPLDRVLQHLPELPGVADSAPGYFDLGEDSAELGYASRMNKWSASVDQYLELAPNIKLDYGLQLNSRLGAGGRFTRDETLSEFILNGVFAPKKNVRLRLTGAQLRDNEGTYLSDGNGPSAVLQNSYLLNVRKTWRKYEFLSDVGLTAYSTEATEINPEPEAFGRKQGYLVDIGLKPTPRSRLELGREFSHLSYYLGDAASQATQHNASRVKYSQYLDRCVRVQGGFYSSPDSGRLDLNIARHNWSLKLSREQTSDGDSTAVHVGYAIPLGTRPSRSPTCARGPDNVPAFEPIVDASVARPPQLPSGPVLLETP